MINNNNSQYKLSEPFNYQNDYEYSLNDQFSFWNDVSKKYCHWDKEYEGIFSKDNNNCNGGEWFKGGLLNTCYNALDKHIISGRGNEIAFVHEIPLKHVTHQITYQELYNKVCRLSRSLKNLGIKKGDVVVLYMHNSFELIISALACARIGAIHNITFGAFFSDILIEMINRCKPAAIIVSNYGYVFNEKTFFYKSLLEAYSNPSTIKPAHTILYQRNDLIDGANKDEELVKIKENKDFTLLNWDDLISDKVEPLKEYELLEPNHPLYIIFSSGTTSKPKAIVRETAGHIIGANYSLRNNYGLKQGDTFFSKASMGWINGHTMVIYGSLFVGAKSIFLEGTFSSNNYVNEFWSLIEKYKVNVMSTTPTTIKDLIKKDQNGELASKFNLSSLKKITISSDKTHQSLIEYINNILKRPILCNEYGLSETSGVIIVNSSNHLKITNDSIGKPAPGYNIKIISKSTNGEIIENKANEIGEIVFKQPVFPFISLSQYNDDENQSLFKEYYLNEYKGYYRTKDLGYFDENGLWYYSSRSDDSICVGGYTLNTVVIENEILKYPNVNDCCVIGLNDEMQGQIPLGLLILQNEIINNNQDNYNQILNELKSQINSFITKSLSFGANLSDIVIVKEIPKTKSGKKIKSLITSIFNNEPFSIPPSIQDESVIGQLLIEYSYFKKNKTPYYINNK